MRRPTWLLSALTLKYVITMYPPPFVHVLLRPRVFSLWLQAQSTKLTEGSFSLSSSTRTFQSLSAHNEASFLWYAYRLKLRNAELRKNLYHLWFHCLDRLLLPPLQVYYTVNSKVLRRKTMQDRRRGSVGVCCIFRWESSHLGRDLGDDPNPSSSQSFR